MNGGVFGSSKATVLVREGKEVKVVRFPCGHSDHYAFVQGTPNWEQDCETSMISQQEMDRLAAAFHLA
jgi:hypothetical protein